MRLRRRHRIRKYLLWGFLFVASTLAGALAFAYSYITDSETLAALIREESPRYLPTSTVQVERVQLRPLVGDVEMRGASVYQRIDGKNVMTLHIPWMQVRSDLRAVFSGKVIPREVAVAQPRLRLVRRKDGTWNIQGLLADPFPQTNLPKPIVTISGGAVELDDGKEVLNRVTLRIEPISDGSYKFEGAGRGTSFERVAIAGTFHPKTGRLVLTQGDLTGLAISESLRNRLPESLQEPLKTLGLERGEVDVSVARLTRDPKARNPLDYDVRLTLREGVWKHPEMPFPLTGLSASASINPKTIRVDHAEGHDGKTIVHVENATLSALDPANGPLDATVRVENLELDERLRAKTPGKLKKLWEEYAPPGRPNAGQARGTVRATRVTPGAPILYDLDADLLDVAINYAHFKYPLEHVRGKLRSKDKKVTIAAETVVGGKPLTGRGTIIDPGPNAVVNMTFTTGAMPIDKTLLDALPPDARKVVEDFRPEGSVSGTAVLTRVPDPIDPKGKVEVHAELDLIDGCSMRWKGLPYPITNVSGHLSLHPNRWVFTGIKGENNLARISASGRVDQISKGKFNVDIGLTAEHLPFDKQLRDSLPPEWARSWGILNPVGSSHVAARIVLVPGKDDYKITLKPDPDTHIQLRLTPAPGTEVASGLQVIELPRMNGVTGTFTFDNGLVTMRDAAFTFRQAPAHFTEGTVHLKNSGAFDLSVSDLSIKGLRLEAELRKIMPKVMSEFARRVDDGKTFNARGDLKIAWSGIANDPAVCSWEKAHVVFNGNSVAAGVPIEHIQGEIRDLGGRFDGLDLSVEGVVDLESVSIRGQHLTKLSSPLKVGKGRADLSDVEAEFLGGKLYGNLGVSLDTTPRYEAKMKLVGARLERLAQTIPGPQDFKGDLQGWVEVEGLGQDAKALKGRGEAHVANGDLGKLPILLDLIQPLNLPSRGRTKFDSADVSFTLDNGMATLDPIKFTSDRISLQGSGTIGHLGALDLRFTPLPGRDERLWFQGIADAIRAVEGQFVVIKVGGTASQHKVTPEFLPTVARGAGRMMKKMGERR